MKLGVSIKSIALRSDSLKSDKKIHLAGFDHLSSYLQFLREHGVSSIELRIYKRDDPFELFEESIGLILQQGFDLTIHGDLAGSVKEEDNFLKIYPSLKNILFHSNLKQQKVIMPIHAYQSKTTDSESLKISSIDTFSKWTKLVEVDQLPIYFALENNREKEINDPCNNIQGVMDIVEAVNSEHMRICWDMGHYISNITKRKQDSLYQARLLPYIKDVIHTHIHGLNDSGTTHCPIINDKSLPVETYINLLKEAQYNGVYNVEFSFDRWEENVREQLSKSLQRLYKAIYSEEPKVLMNETLN
ncbi:MAG TPA: hypothetical protein H9895_10415 [Candidatus Pseudogracilibacillus intestinigallinarum]|uniref:Xylose isomerase-like TIM barrel domain-containing protein n=1 Tax=Candidatus Pseudogracilibacillus intestinigallinarum TaxID=2838742 RepID=A0A9D1PN42_9BACI|nr:hypothetical protein [Candidatus Pseudogracilibacillus intestinigallinarum]